MEAKLESKYAHLQQSLTGLIAQLDSLPEKQLRQRPEGAWNAVQILYHLSISERGTVGYLNKKLSDGTAKIENAGLAAFIRSVLLQRALRNYNKKFRAPKMVADIPDQPDYAETKQIYLRARADLKSTLEKFDKEKMGKAYFRHPRAGRISILQTMDFLQDHFDRHAQQIQERSAAV